MGNLTTGYIDALVQSGSLTTALAVQEAAADQVNTATTGSTGDASTTNQSWGKAIPVLIGHTRSVCLPLWIGNPTAVVDDAGDETDTIDFAVYIGRPGPREQTATLLRVWFDNVLVYDVADATVTTLNGDALTFTFYDGTQTAPDPVIVKAQGAAVPAFTDTMYVVFTDLLTRYVNATTTTTQFSKLPEVQCEVQQSQPSTLTGAVVYPFDKSNLPADGDPHYVYYSYKLGRYYVFTDTLVSVYDVPTLTLLGRTAIVGFGVSTIGHLSPQVMDEDGILYGTGFDDTWYAFDVLSGSIVASTPPHHGLPDSQGVLYNLGFGFILNALGFTSLVYFDGTTFAPCNFDNWRSLYEGTVQCEQLASLIQLPTFKAVGMVYLTANGGSYIRRLILTPKGDKTVVAQVGLVTADGSSSPVMKGTQADIIYTLPQGETFAAVMVDRADPTLVYAIVNTLAGSQLRKYATFYYWNAQVGTTLHTTIPAVYSNFDNLVELSRLDIPQSVYNDEPSYTAMYSRDKRYSTMVYPAHRSIVVLDFKAGAFRQYLDGEYYDTTNKPVGTFVGYDTRIIKLGADDTFLACNMGYFGAGSDAIRFPAKIRPASTVQDEAPYSLSALYTDLATLAGYDLTEVSCTNMDDTVTGLQLNQSVSFTDLMAQLDATFRVDMLEQPDGMLKFTRQPDNRVPDYTITPDLLLLASTDDTGNAVAITRVSTNELPTVLQLSFINEDFGFQVGAATVRRVSFPLPTAHGASSLALSVPVVMTSEQATYYAGIALFDMWSGKQNYQVNLPPMFFFMESGDFVELIRPSGRVDLCKVTEISVGADKTLAVTLSGVAALKPIPYTQTATKPGSSPVLALPASHGTFTTPSPSGMFATVIDNIALSGDLAAGDIAFYCASSVPADFYMQFGTLAPVKIGSTVGSVMGLASSPLPEPVDLADRTGTVAVTLDDGGQLVPIGPGLVAIGAPGRWEMIGYAAAVQVGATVTLSGLQRATLGSFAAAGAHETADTAIFSPTGLLRASAPISALGQAVTVYAMKPGTPAAPTGGVVDALTLTGAALLPLAPLFPTVKRAQNGDLLFSWFRQDPVTPANFFDPVTESFAPELYHLTLPAFRNGGAVSRVLNCAATSYLYSAADQATDGNTSATRYNISIAQVSAAVGEGHPCGSYVYVR